MILCCNIQLSVIFILLLLNYLLVLQYTHMTCKDSLIVIHVTALNVMLDFDTRAVTFFPGHLPPENIWPEFIKHVHPVALVARACFTRQMEVKTIFRAAIFKTKLVSHDTIKSTTVGIRTKYTLPKIWKETWMTATNRINGNNQKSWNNTNTLKKTYKKQSYDS